MSTFHRALGAAALGLVCSTSQAAVVFSTASLTGDVSVTGFADGTPSTFSAAYSNLAGSVNATVVPDGDYTVVASGAASFTGFAGPGGTVTLNVVNPTPVFTGHLSSSGLTAGSYAFNFGAALPMDVPFSFAINYDGAASPQVMSALALLGLPFVDPTGAGTLEVSGMFLANGSGAVVNFTESNLTWTGFGATLAGLDAMFGGANGIIDGNFALRDVVVSVPEPTTLALVGASLLAAAATRRRRSAPLAA